MKKLDSAGVGHLILVVLSALVLGAIGFAVWRVVAKDTNSSFIDTITNKQDVSVKFSENIFEPSDIDHIAPLGELNGGYDEAQAIASILIFIKPEKLANGQEIAIKAPAAMTLESYAYYQVGEEPNSWTLIFNLSPDLTMKMDHITRASDKIVAATTSTPGTDSREQAPKSKVSFAPGEVIAYTSGTSKAHNWNIYMYDKKHKNTFVNQPRYEQNAVGKRLVNAVCPFDYYDTAKKSSFLALMGQNRAGEAKSCGEVSRDKKGSLAGMWHFAQNASAGIPAERSGKYDSPISIYNNAADVATVHQVSSRRLDIEASNPSYKDPAEITGEHCYRLSSGYAFFKIVSDTEMKFAYSGSGACPAAFPAAGAQTYYR